MSVTGHNCSVLDWPNGVTVYKPEKCYNGYTVVNSYRSEMIFLIDMIGRVVHLWRADYEKRGESWFTRRLSNGNWMSLIYRSLHLADASSPARDPNSFSYHDFEKEVIEFDWYGNVVWHYNAPENWNIHHDMVRLQNGNTLILMEKAVKVPSISDKPIAENFFIELDPQQKIVWEWYTTEHFDEFGYSGEARRLMYEYGRDIFHTNTLSVLPGNRLEKKISVLPKETFFPVNETLIIFILLISKVKKWYGSGGIMNLSDLIIRLCYIMAIFLFTIMVARLDILSGVGFILVW